MIDGGGRVGNTDKKQEERMDSHMPPDDEKKPESSKLMAGMVFLLCGVFLVMLGTTGYGLFLVLGTGFLVAGVVSTALWSKRRR